MAGTTLSLSAPSTAFMYSTLGLFVGSTLMVSGVHSPPRDHQHAIALDRYPHLLDLLVGQRFAVVLGRLPFPGPLQGISFLFDGVGRPLRCRRHCWWLWDRL